MTGSARPQYGHSRSPYSTSVTGASSGPRTWSRSGSMSSERSRMSSPVAMTCRARTRGGRRLTTANTPEAMSGATIAVASTPSLASSRSRPANARLQMRSATVKPMPATAPPPASTGQLTNGRGPWTTRREATHEAPRIPSGLPAT